MCSFRLEVVLFLWILQGSKAQDTESSCYGPGSIATSVIVTIIVTILFLYILYVIWKRYWPKRKGKHLVLETDPEKGKDEYAYDNAAFGDVSSTPLDKATEKNGRVDSTKSKWSQWSPLGAFMAKNEKPKTLDDSALQAGEIKTVSLKSHDFTGLGFNIYGNMREGIFIKDILHRGPASESGKLNSGDRIRSVTINFEHVVYEDALTILSYASPYEVILEVQGGRIGSIHQTVAKTLQLGHPLYRSSSTTDLMQIQKTSRKRLFPVDDPSASPYSSLQKKRISSVPTLERERSRSPRLDYQNSSKTVKTHSPQHLKTQLEQKISQNHKQQLKSKDERLRQESAPVLQKTENKYQKFGIKVLPMDSVQLPREQTSPKSAELSQNDNNINLERHLDKVKVAPAPPDVKVEEKIDIDEVDRLEKKLTAPPVKKREKASKSDEDVVQADSAEEEGIRTDTFVRRNSGTGGSGIKRDKDGIPQEIPSHMLNAAVAARRNRRTSTENASGEDVKSPKKQKGRAPAPPASSSTPNDSRRRSEFKLDDLNEMTGDPEEDRPKFDSASDNKKHPPDYASDSDAETDNQSSVNTIELNASHITVHQSEDIEEVQNRRTASTGDLTKIQRTRKTSTGTLERAQSLDITDTAMPPLNKKRRGGGTEENLDSKSGSDESLYGKALVHKEPRLSLALDGLNTFQRSRLKKSTEWGNLEDAILNLNRSDSGSHFDAVVNKINQIKQESSTVDEKDTQDLTNGSFTTNESVFEQSSTEFSLPSQQVEEMSEKGHLEWNKTESPRNSQTENVRNDITTVSFVTLNTSSEPNCANKDGAGEVLITSEVLYDDGENSYTPKIQDAKSSYARSCMQEIPHKTAQLTTYSLLPNLATASENLLHSERRACNADPFYNLSNKIYDTNISDDIKVSRHSLGSQEITDNFKHLNTSSGNVSSITINDQDLNDTSSNFKTPDIIKKSSGVRHEPYTENDDELYTTALDTTTINENFKNDTNKEGSFGFQRVSVASPNIIKNVAVAEAFHDVRDTITVEGPTSLTLEIPNDSFKSSDEKQISNRSFQISTPTTTVTTHQEHSPKSSYSLTYITEIQVLTPNKDESESTLTNVSAENQDKNRKHFESNIKQFESHIHEAHNLKSTSANEKIDPQKELHKIQEIAEEQLKKLPEMRFSTSSYETNKSLENCSLQIDQLRSNFEKSPPKTPPKVDVTKSRIPVATSKTPPTSPERRDSRNFDLEVDKEIVAIMSSPVHSTPISMNLKYQTKTASKNVSVTSIRSSSKIPSGFPNRPPVPPRKYDTGDSDGASRLPTNGSLDSSFKQWVFNPNDNSITNLTVTENKTEHK